MSWDGDSQQRHIRLQQTWTSPSAEPRRSLEHLPLTPGAGLRPGKAFPFCPVNSTPSFKTYPHATVSTQVLPFILDNTICWWKEEPREVGDVVDSSQILKPGPHPFHPPHPSSGPTETASILEDGSLWLGSNPRPGLLEPPSHLLYLTRSPETFLSKGSEISWDTCSSGFRRRIDKGEDVVLCLVFKLFSKHKYDPYLSFSNTAHLPRIKSAQARQGAGKQTGGGGRLQIPNQGLFIPEPPLPAHQAPGAMPPV